MCGPRRTRTCTRRRRPPTRRRAHIADTRSLAASAATPDSPGSPHRCRTTTGTPQPTSDSARPLVVAPHSRAVDYSGQMNTPERRYTSGHGDGSGDRYGCEEPLMITGRAVSALLLHHHRRVVVRRAVNYDFAGALPSPGRGPLALTVIRSLVESSRTFASVDGAGVRVFSQR